MSAHLMAVIVLAGLLGPGLIAGAGRRPERESDRVAPGLWGGPHLRMVVGPESSRLEYDCATGTIDEPLVPDRSDRFTAKGSYTPERGGPRRDGRPATSRVRYVGQLTGDTMKLTVTLEEGRQQVGIFTVTRGEDPLLTKCR